jgi:hypothetical protein
VTRIDGLQFGRALVARVREIILTRDLLHERLAVLAKAFDREKGR